jgi:WD40 repeat protein
VTVAAALLAVLAVLAVVSVRRIVAERDDAAAARAVAEEQQVVAEEQRAAAEVARGDAIARQHALLLTNARSALQRDPTETLAWLAQVPIDPSTAPEVRRIAADAIGRGISRHVLRGHARGTQGIAFLPGGKLATADRVLDVRLWDLASGKGTLIGAMQDILYGAIATPDGQFATYSRSSKFRVWDPATGKAARSLDGGKRDATVPSGGGLAAHPDGIHLAIADGSPRIAIWNTVSGELRTLTTELTGQVDLEFSLDGRRLASGGQDGQIRVFDLERNTERRLRGPTPGWVESVSWSPDGRHLATTGGGETILVWDVEDGSVQELIGHDGEGNRVVFSADGRRVFSGSADHAVRAWDLATGDSQQWLGHAGPVVELAMSPDGRWLASADTAGGLRMWEVATGQVRVLAGHREVITALTFSPDGAWLASISKDGTARVWAVDREEHRSLVGHTRRVGHATYSADGRWLATVGLDDAVWHWDPATGRGVRSGPISRSYGELCFLSDEETVLMTYEAIWKIESDGRTTQVAPPSSRARWTQRAPDGTPLVATFEGKILALGAGGLSPRFDHGAPITYFEVVPDGRVITAGSDNLVRVWQPGQATPVAEQPFTDTVYGIDARGEGGAVRVVTAGGGFVTVTEVPSGTAVRLAVAQPRSSDFSPDGSRLLITDGEGAVHLWTMATREHVTLAHESVDHAVSAADGTRVYTCGGDGTLRTWTAGGVLLGMHRAGNACYDLARSPDGKTLAVADFDHVTRLWPTSAPLLPADDGALHAYLASLTSAAVLAGDEIGTPP